MIGVVLAREALELPTGLGRALVGLGCAVASALVLAYGWALHLADDRDGQNLWPTAAERAERERERERVQANARADVLEAELAALREELARLRRGE